MRDPEVKYVAAQRWKCLSCNKTFTQRPEGISRALFSDFVISLAVFLYTLRLSYDSVSNALLFLEISIDPSTIWRHVQEVGKKLRNKPKDKHLVAGFDQTYMKVKGIKKIVNMAFSTDEFILDVEILPNETSETFKKKIERLKEELGLEVLVIDDHTSYKGGFIETGVERQLCLIHMLKNVNKWLKKIGFDLEERERIKEAIRGPTRGVKSYMGDVLKRLKERGNREVEVQFLLKLTEKWRDLTTYERRGGIPRDNNFTERGIGRTKIRHKTTRGMKSEEGLLNFVYITQEIWKGVRERR